MRRDLTIGLLLAALTLSVYWPVRNHDFIVYDDPQFITENPQIQSGLTRKTVAYAFSRPVAGNWHPLTTLSHALDCELLGENAGAHHLVNVAFHAANAALLFWMLCQMTGARWRSACVAAIFAWHPLRVESVAWVAERKDLLSGFFFLLTLWMYALFAQRKGDFRTEVVQPGIDTASQAATKADTNSTNWHEQSPAKSVKIGAIRVSHPSPSMSIRGAISSFRTGRGSAWVFYLLALVFFSLGLMSKPMVVTLPFVLLLMDYWPLGRFTIANGKWQMANRWPLLVEKVPFLLLSIVDCWVTLTVQRGVGAMQVIRGITWPERVGNAIASYVRYLGKLFWPADLAVVYPHPAQHYYLSDGWPSWETAVAAVLLVLVTVLVVRFAARCPYLAVGWFWFLGMLVPVIGLVQVGEQAMADRYSYLPLIGPVIALVWWVSERIGLAQAGAENPVEKAAKGMIGADLWQAFRRSPTVACAALVLAAVLVLVTRHQLGYWQNSVTLFEHAIASTGDNPSAQFAVGVGLEREGEVGRAMVRYRVAVAIDPRYSTAYYNLGQLLRKAGKWREAADAYQSAERENPTDVATRLNLASALARLGRTHDAVVHFQEALRLEPDSIEGLNNLAWLLATCNDDTIRDGARAVQLAEHACVLTDHKQGFLLGTLAAAYAEAGRFAEAVEAGQRACSMAIESGDSYAAVKNHELVELYRANKPCRVAE